MSGRGKSNGLGKGNWDAKEHDRDRRRGRGSHVASQALSPAETVVGSLCPSQRSNRWRRGWWRRVSHADIHSLVRKPLDHLLSMQATGPVFPEDRMRKRSRRRNPWWRWGGIRGRRRGRERPIHRTDSSRFEGRHRFLALRTQRAAATMAQAGGIQDTQRAIALRTALLWIEGMIGRATQRPIGLQHKGGTGKAPGKRRMGPVRRSILHGRARFAGRCWLDERLSLRQVGRSKFGRAQGLRMQGMA